MYLDDLIQLKVASVALYCAKRAFNVVYLCV